ncbi:hypothetical protein ONZ45_g6160 [Pleurotus djamor]|nr:hypothetical protein ONZ45_g6160 [Pleurotus djamor]
MRVISFVFAISSVGFAAAQNNIVVQVGATADAPGGVFQFNPSSVTASQGDTVTFKFTGAPGNHSVTQSSFASPCTPLEGGFDSGWVSIPQSNVSQSPEWVLTINNASAPIWFYCKQLNPAPHCVQGMVGAINAPTTGDRTFQAFASAATAFNGTVGQGGGGSLSGVGAAATAAPGPIESGAQAFGAPSTISGGGANGSSPASPSPSAGNGSVSFLAAMSPVSILLVAFGLVAGATM